MGDPRDPTPYPIDPEPEGGRRPDGPSEGAGGGGGAGEDGGGGGGGDRKPRIDQPGFLDEFDEDADFSSDPELEAAVAAGARPPAPEASKSRAKRPPPGPPMVKGGDVADRTWLIAAGVALLVAITMALIWQEQARPAHVGLTIYGAVVNTGLGLASIYLAARLLDRRLGEFERAMAPVAFAACLAQVGRQIPIELLGPHSQIEELALAAAVYALVLWGLFRWEARTLGVVLGLHFLVWLVIVTGAQLQSCAAG